MKEVTSLFTKPIETELGRGVYTIIVKDFVKRKLAGAYGRDAGFVCQRRIFNPSADFYSELYLPARERIEANGGCFVEMVRYLAGKPIDLFIIRGPAGVVEFLKNLQGRTNGEINPETIRGFLRCLGIRASQNSDYVHVSSKEEVERDLQIYQKFNFVPGLEKILEKIKQ